MNAPPIAVSGEPIITIQHVHYISINILEMVLNTTARLAIPFYDDKYNPIKTEYLELTPEEYSGWVDDNYIINLVCQKYNLTLTSQ